MKLESIGEMESGTHQERGESHSNYCHNDRNIREEIGKPNIFSYTLHEFEV